MRVLDSNTFQQIKTYSRIMRAWRVANKFDVSEKTVLQVRGSKNYAEYKENVKAQHPPIQFSLRDEVLELHRMVIRKDDTYIPPKTAQRAILELKERLK